jgi:hypothetical protein
MIMSTFGSLTETCGTPLSVKLLAGQTIDSGTVTVANDSERICVKFEGKNGWYLTETHFAIGKNFADIPQNRAGNPIPGQFPYARSYQSPLLTDSFCFKMVDLDIAPGDFIYIAAHAVVEKQLSDGTVQNETGWGEGEGFTGKNWSMYFVYTVQACDNNGGGGGCSGESETAFAVGDKTFTQIADADPVTFPTGVTRWGWQITVNAASGIQCIKEIYAGAAQNDISKGTLVGQLKYTYDGSVLNLEYVMLDGFRMHETHVYAGTEDTNTIAPGQYGNQHELDHAATDSYAINISGSTIYVIAHAVVCPII